MEGIVSGALTVWWTVASIVLTRYSLQADAAGVPKHGWRTSVWALAWAMAGLWGLCVLVKFMVSVLRCCASKATATAFSPYNYSMNGAAGASPPPTRPPAHAGSKDPEVPSPTAPVFPQTAWPQEQFMTPEPV